jgi:hypothetical protein
VRADVPRDLRAIHDELMAPVASLHPRMLDAARLRCVAVQPGSVERRVADRIIDYGYALRYRDAMTNGPDEIPEIGWSNVVLAAVQRLDGRDLVVGTIRVRWEDVEVFELFELPARAVWPHEALGVGCGELARFAVHPLVDTAAYASEPGLRAHGRTYRLAIWNALADVFERVLLERGRRLIYHMASPRVETFLEDAGYRSTRVETARPSGSGSALELRQRWWRYFHPDAPDERRPHVFYRLLR